MGFKNKLSSGLKLKWRIRDYYGVKMKINNF